MDEKILSSVGLSQKEIKIYRAAIRAGVATPVTLAKATGIKRTTAYSLARGLCEKGLLSEDATKRPRVFVPSSPKEVEEIIVEERKRLGLREKVFKQLANELSKTQAEKSYPVPQIRFVPEEKITQFLKVESPKWDRSMLKYDAIMWGFQDHTYVEQFAHAVETYWKQAPKQIQLKMLTNQSEVELKIGKRYPRRQMKTWAKGNFIAGIWVMGDYLVTVNTRQKPYYIVEIHDATLAHDLREIFKNLWEAIK